MVVIREKKIVNTLIRKLFFSFILICIFLSCKNRKQEADVAYARIDSLIHQKQFFLARDLWDEHANKLNALQYLKVGALLDNAFNRLEASNEKINRLFNLFGTQLKGEDWAKFLGKRQENFGKLGMYKNAYENLSHLIDSFASVLSESEIKNYKNTAKIWQFLSHYSPQSVKVSQAVTMKMKKDEIGFYNLPVSNGKVIDSFIFDTGANFSTVAASTAGKFGMEISDSVIQVGAITGNMVSAHIAICKRLRIGDILAENVVFLVFPDSALFIKQVPFQISGIIGFPVIEALNEIKLSTTGELKIPEKQTTYKFSNLALDFLTPVISIDKDSYAFDTGANETHLYSPYYKKYQHFIDSSYSIEKEDFYGVGGITKKQVFRVKFEALLGDKKISIDSIPLFSQPIRKSENYFGNIGQDVIKKFEYMTLNFRQMFIRFE